MTSHCKKKRERKKGKKENGSWNLDFAIKMSLDFLGCVFDVKVF